MKQWVIYIAIFLGGVVLASRVRNLPGGSSLPTL